MDYFSIIYGEKAEKYILVYFDRLISYWALESRNNYTKNYDDHGTKHLAYYF